MTDASWREVCEAVRAHAGIALPATMRELVARTLDELGVRDYAKAFAQPALRERFLDRLFLGTSWFYREHAGIEALVQALVPIARRRADGVVTVWSAGCAAGQEPYALAMALVDAGCSPRIIATDFHRPSLEIARAGSYPAAACAKLPTPWRERYFDEEPDGRRRVRDSIRARVHFVQHNFATDAPIAAQVDAVVCRNVLIYFERADAIVMIARLASACREGGLLLVGAVEAPLLWMSVNDPRFGGGAIPLVAISRGSPLRTPAAGTLTTSSRVHRSRALAASPAPTTVAALAKSRELERAGQLAAALRVLDGPIVAAPLDASGHLARGLLLKQQGELPEAIRELRAARFLDPTTWLAPYQLAICLERIGETEDALEAYRHAAATIAAGGASGICPADEAVEMLAATTSAACRAKLRADRTRSQHG